MATERPARHWLRLALEGVVVLVSILAAFYLEGWRDDRELDRDLRLELLNVRLELQRNRDIVTAEIAAIERVISSGTSLVSMLRASPSSDRIPVPDTIAWLGALYSPTMELSLGAVDALITSGRLSRIDDSELRLGLAGLEEMFEDVAQEGIEAQRITFDQLFPLIRGGIDMALLRGLSEEILTAGQVAGATPQERFADRALPSYGTVDYPNTVAIRTVHDLKLIWYISAISELQPLIPHIDHLEALLTAAIE
ncbi:MAG: hypothetical protein JSU98_14805 [Gemmatimonadales bacterium]|nr:MAG: hypothetical protein JSU98_14805 [Gemmatimonadales bacterium]